ncbi:MAG TPA: amidohydrolase/deacetylase family metallohydrolase [Bryobacterales bacterium]|nr:amidohydrolase/deacetylase family metallohydrolase [Bryobacterales bacterium]
MHKLLGSVLLLAPLALAQPYDLLLTGGHVIDPANNIDAVMDVAVSGSQIARVAANIPRSEARKAVDVSGLYVTPGLIDLHAHVYGYSGAIFPDDTQLVTGTTTVVDAGGSGWRTFDDFKARIIDKSQTRVLVFINIVGHGMVPPWESDPDDMDPEKTAAKMKEYPNLIVGIKTAHFGRPGWTAIDRAVEAGRLSGKPVIVDSGILTPTGRNSRDELLDHLRPGDLRTHTYNDRQVTLVDRFSGRVEEYIRQARRRGLLFDMGHGAGSFLWPVATRAMAQGFPPDTISTDLHSASIMVPQSDMPNCITKLMSLGMTLEDAIARSTVNPARAIHRFPELGTLSPGHTADISVFALRTGVFALKDAWDKKRMASRKLECVLTVRNGKIAFDQDGLSCPLWTTAGDYNRIP